MHSPERSWEQLPKVQRAAWEELFATTRPPIKLLQLVNSQLQLESYVPRMMSEIAHGDPLLSGKLLAAANSAAISPVKRVTSIRQALLLLGFLVVRSIIMAYMLDAMFAKAAERNPQLMAYLRKWLCAASVITFHWAVEAGLDDADTMSTAVLLSRVGALLVASENQFADKYMASQDELWRAEYELEKWSVASPLISAEQVRRWGIPEPIPRYITNQRLPFTHELEPTDDNKILTVMCASLPLAEQALNDSALHMFDCFDTASYFALKQNIQRFELEASLHAAWERHVAHDLDCILQPSK